MSDYYLVEYAQGPAWVADKRRQEQPGWHAHAAFMDNLVEGGFIVLGGPVGDLEGDQALLVVDARTEEEARTRLATDPWVNGVLSIQSVRPWTVWLRRDQGR